MKKINLRNGIIIVGAFFILMFFLAVNNSTARQKQPDYPKPYGALPSANQLAWHEMETYVLIHFTPTTFQNKEWGYGDADPKIFNPVKFDANQIVKAVKDGGFKGVIVVAKHHDGFCLWPTKTTDYNISNSPFRNGKGDMVKEYEVATRKAGLKLGLYCSPWDRNNKDYGKPEYVQTYKNQLTELLTNYGDLFISWYDGANGGDGYYGGAREERKIDKVNYYGWNVLWPYVKTLQPKTVIFSDNGDIRWVGNEQGYAGETSWATFVPESNDGKSEGAPGDVKSWLATEGTRNGKYWKPAECDVPLRPGWFYHPSQDNQTKSPYTLFDLYCKSVGRGACFDVGIAPNTEGLLAPKDVASLKGFGELLQKTFQDDLARQASFSASNIRKKNVKLFGPEKLKDGDRYSYWATDEDVTTPSVSLSWAKPVQFNIIRIRENIKLGQRIEKIGVEIWENGQWQKVAEATSIGSNRLIRLNKYVTTDKLRINILQSPVCIALSEVGVFKEPETLSTPTISRSKLGLVSIVTTSPVSEIRYTLDGSEPDKNSMLYQVPFRFEHSGIVKAKAFTQNTSSEIVNKLMGESKKDWKIRDCSFNNAENEGQATFAIDDDENTMWHTWKDKQQSKVAPQFIAIDLGASLAISAFTYTPRKNSSSGVVKEYEWQVSDDGKTWRTVSIGEFANIKANPVEQTISLSKPEQARYIKFIGLSTVADNYVSAAELGVVF